ncbi:MAG TPA: hypothetical protein VF139_08170 [Candidatus Polarisedimenticolaceae bacterium]
MKLTVKSALVTAAAILFVSAVIAQEPPAPPPTPAPAPAPAPTPAPPPAAVPPVAMAEEAKITIDGKADGDGKMEVVFTPAQGTPVTITVLVAKKMKPKEVAEDLAKNLKVSLGEGYKVEQNDEKVEIKAKDDKKFSIAVGGVTVPGMSVSLKLK